MEQVFWNDVKITIKQMMYDDDWYKFIFGVFAVISIVPFLLNILFPVDTKTLIKELVLTLLALVIDYSIYVGCMAFYNLFQEIKRGWYLAVAVTVPVSIIFSLLLPHGAINFILLFMFMPLGMKGVQSYFIDSSQFNKENREHMYMENSYLLE